MEEILKTFDLTVRDGQMILVGSVVFYAFWCIIDSLVLKPFIKLFEAREALTTGATSSSKNLNEEAASIYKKCEDEIHAARVAAIAEKQQALLEAKNQGATVISRAENEVQESVRKARWDRESALTATKASVMNDADTLAKTIADRLKQPTSSVSARN